MTPTIKMASGNVVPIPDISPKQFYQKTEIIKQVLKYRYWLGKGLHFGLSMHFNTKVREFQYKNFKLYNLYKRET